MPKTPTIRATWLGQEMRKLRDEAGLSAREAGRYLYRDGSSVTRMENGEVPVSEEMLGRWIEMCGLKDPRRVADLEFIRKDVAQTGWWDGYRGEIASTLMDRAWIEARASGISSFEQAVVPGLLQTPEYAEAVIRSVSAGASDGQVSRWVEVRMNRQTVVAGHKPIRFESIIEESALTRPVIRGQLMRAQLDYLLVMIERPNVEMRVLPDSAGAHAGLAGAFEVYAMIEPYPMVGIANTAAGELCVEGETVDHLAAAYDRLREICLGPEASRELIIAERNKL